MIVIGLTGSIGMGKSTTAGFFAERGAAIHDADAAVRELYRGEAVAPIAQRFPAAIVDGAVDRGRLAAALAEQPKALQALESIVHPMARAVERRFLAQARAAGVRVAVLDIPLLLETVGDRRIDAVVVATATASIQAKRVMARPGMTRERFELLLSRQMADGEKRQRAHFLVDTGDGLDRAKRAVDDILRALSAIAH